MAACISAAPRAAEGLEMGSAVGSAGLDPKDGPDVDLRVAVEDDEVRLIIITNLAFLDATTEAPREEEGTLAPVEAPDAMEALYELFASRNEIKIDGAVVQPILPDVRTDFEFDPGDPTLFPHFLRLSLIHI